jgi:hypothetical protein
MKWESLLKEFSERPLFHSSMLPIFDDAPVHIGKFSTDWLKGLRLQNLNILDEDKLRGWAALVSKPGFAAAVDAAAAYIRDNREG